MTPRDAYLAARRVDASYGATQRGALAKLEACVPPERRSEFKEAYDGGRLFRAHWKHCAETALRMMGLVTPVGAVEQLIAQLADSSEEERETLRHCALVVLHEGARGCAVGEVSVWRAVLADGESWSVEVRGRSAVLLQRSV